jgi:hypothetical protein
MNNTLEVIYQINMLFYGYEDKDSWPESAKLFYNRMATVFAKIVIGSGMGNVSEVDFGLNVC